MVDSLWPALLSTHTERITRERRQSKVCLPLYSGRPESGDGISVQWEDCLKPRRYSPSSPKIKNENEKWVKISDTRADTPTSKPPGLKHMSVCRARRDEVLLQEVPGHLHNGAEGPLQDPLRPVTSQGAGCFHQFIPRCWAYFWAHFWLEWRET